MVVDMLFINMGADNKRMAALGESPCQFHAQAVCFLRGDLTGAKGLPDLISDHIIISKSTSLNYILAFGKKKLCIRYFAATLVARNKLTVSSLLRVLYIGNAGMKDFPLCSSPVSVEGHDTRSGHTYRIFDKARRIF